MKRLISLFILVLLAAAPTFGAATIQPVRNASYLIEHEPFDDAIVSKGSVIQKVSPPAPISGEIGRDAFEALTDGLEHKALLGDAFTNYQENQSLPFEFFHRDDEGNDQGADRFSSSVPILSGASNGTIAPAKAPFPPRRKTKVTFFQDPVSIVDVKSALLSEGLHSVEVRPSYDPPFTNNTSLAELLHMAKVLRGNSDISLRLYSLWVSGVQNGQPKTYRLGDVFVRRSPDSILQSLFSRAAQLADNDIDRHIYLGQSACHAGDWQTAWSHFQIVYELAPHDSVVCNSVIDVYREFPSRDLESAIWLTRYLRIAPDWVCFELAYDERERLETVNTIEASYKENSPNLAWSEGQLPVKVAFRHSDDPAGKLKNASVEALGDWVRSTGGRVDFVETSEEKKSDILVEWAENFDQYASYDHLAKLPDKHVTKMPLGDTETLASGQKIVRVYFGRGEEHLSEDDLKFVCLHELGHALGINTHLRRPSDVMYAFKGCKCNGDSLDLSDRDKAAMFELYQNHPIRQDALWKYLGQSAHCQKLDEGSAQTGSKSEMSSTF